MRLGTSTLDHLNGNHLFHIVFLARELLRQLFVVVVVVDMFRHNLCHLQFSENVPKYAIYIYTASFRHQSKRNETELSKHIWTLKDNNKPFTIKWRIIKQCRPYNNISNKCNLCLFEKFVIICKKNLCSLNKRNELASSCPHRNRYLLKNFVIK